MKVILKTERLYLREFILSDGFDFYHLNKDAEVLKYTGDIPFNSIEEATNFIKNYSDYSLNGFGRWAVCMQNTNEFIGWCGLKYNKVLNEVDLGFRFYKKYWRKGFATEAGKACLDYGFSKLKLTNIVGRVYVGNKGSINVLEKCNMKFIKYFNYDNKEAMLYRITNDRN